MTTIDRQPLRNAHRFTLYPMFRVAAILDDADDTRTALDTLEQAGVDLSTVDLLTGREEARALGRTGRRRGWGARLLRSLQRGAYEGEALQAHEHALEDGRNVIFVPARGNAESYRVAEILRTAGGQHILHFHPWHVALP